MILSESDLEKVVAELSRQGAAGGAADKLLDRFLRRQKLVGHYVASYGKELGLEAIGRVLLHAAVIARAVEQALERPLPQVVARDLDQAAIKATDSTAFHGSQPAMADYLTANVAGEEMFEDARKRMLGLHLLRVIGLALAERAEQEKSR